MNKIINDIIVNNFNDLNTDKIVKEFNIDKIYLKYSKEELKNNIFTPNLLDLDLSIYNIRSITFFRLNLIFLLNGLQMMYLNLNSKLNENENKFNYSPFTLEALK